MKSIFCLVALLVMCLTVSNVSAQVGNEKLHLLVEYFMPYWRQHRARLRPYAFAQPVPLWRVARGAEEGRVEELKVEDKKTWVEESDYVGCLYFKSKLLCQRISNDHPTEERVQCEVKKRFINPALENFVSFSISDKRTEGTSERFTLFPKRPTNMNLELADLKDTRRMTLNWIADSEDEGFSFTHKECWNRMNELLSKIKPTTVRVKKVKSKDDATRGTENIIGNLIQLDFGL